MLQDEAKDLQPEEKAEAAAEPAFDVNQGKHKGQFALRKLYHESDRVLIVLYTSPTCGPCRTLKPIFSKVVDEYDNKVSLTHSLLASLLQTSSVQLSCCLVAVTVHNVLSCALPVQFSPCVIG